MVKTKTELRRIDKEHRPRLESRAVSAVTSKWHPVQQTRSSGRSIGARLSCGAPRHHPLGGWCGSGCPCGFLPQAAVFSVAWGRNSKNPPRRGCFSTIYPGGGLAFLVGFAIIQVTHSPCLSRSAVTHIKGEFFYCAKSYAAARPRQSGGAA